MNLINSWNSKDVFSYLHYLIYWDVLASYARSDVMFYGTRPAELMSRYSSCFLRIQQKSKGR